MSLDQKVGQLYSVWTASKYGQEEINEIKRIINKYHIGGLIFSLGNINDQIISHNIFQEQSNIPLLISMDAEWGLGMRLDDGFSFPYNITLGALRDDSLVFKVGQRIGEH
ncbi:MAG: beta-N-acetylglucosaminidase, partial [Flavobacteriaceae bacterium]|nr:beta-N-acetylglucosaminidase [Flavobacteriaceae bacterium]